MSKKIGTIERKSRRGNKGSFFFGSFIGFILCLALIVGTGCFVYFKVSPSWINKTFKTNIDLGNDEVNKKTLSDFVGGAVGLFKNIDTYTLNDFNDDFGFKIKDKYYGIDISDIKSVPLNDIGSKLEEKFSTISADELRNVEGMNFDSMKSILDETNIYYFDGESKLYKNYDGENYSNEVSFKFTVNEEKNKITTKNHEVSVSVNSKYSVINQVNIPLWYLPLTTAFADFSSNMGEQITLKDLETKFGVDLPSYFDNVDKSTPINGLEEEIKLLKLADFFGYKVSGDDVYQDNNKNDSMEENEEIIGIMAKLSKVQVKDLGNIKENIIDNSTVAEIMGYYEDEGTGLYYLDKDLTNPVTGVMKAAAGKKISQLSTIVDDLYLSDVFDSSEFESGTLSILKGYENTKVVNMATTLRTVMNGLTINDLYTSGIVELTDGQIDKLDNEIVAGSGVTLGEMNVMDIVIAYIDAL